MAKKTVKIVQAERRENGYAHDGNGNGNNVPRFGSKRDVAAMLQFSTRTVDNLLAQGCPHMKIGKRRCRFDLPEVAAWMKDQFGTKRRGPAKAVNASSLGGASESR
jgi:predicted DNA-binding transcriptional regulator AlpA